MADPRDSDYHGNVEQPEGEASFAASACYAATRTKSIKQMSTLELHIESAISYLENSANIEAALCHLAKAKHSAEEATELIARIGTTGVERTDIIQRADKWPNSYL